MRRRAGGSEGAAVHHHVVLHVLNDQRAARRIDRVARLGELGCGPIDSRRRSRCRPGCGRRVLAGAHIGLVARSDLHRHRIDRMRRGDVERAPIRPAPGQIADQFGNAQLADQSAVRRIDPDSARRRNPDIAERVAFHAIRHAGLGGRDDVGGEHPAVAEAAAGIDVEHADQMLDGIVDVEPLLVRRKAQPVRLIEQIAVDQQLRRAAAGRHAIDALEAELARPFDAVDRHPAVPRIGEIDRAVGLDADVVRRIQLQPVEMRRQDLAPPVGAFAHQRGGGVLADDQVQPGIIGHAVALVGRTHRLANALPVETAAHVARHVGEQADHASSGARPDLP